ncbi:MAG TPA: glycosyl hydrolase [Thermoanaerobaculia bacterium]|nr:glycosyl hydrolase [Thermoanaerobaculia bacterium]
MTRTRSISLLALLCALVSGFGITEAADPAPRLTPEILNGLPFRLVGPPNPSGRVWQVAGVADPSGRPSTTFYVCTAGGGVWKTVNNGTTLEPLLDDAPVASCGAVAVAPSDPRQVWVGTGEPASVRSNSQGRGVLKSLDGGSTWISMGLTDSEEIGAIVVHPRDPNVVWAAALGHLWGKNEERGVFKTTDGGAAWTKVLYVDDASGALDLAIDPRNPDVLYASTWHRYRFGAGDMLENGPGSGLWKTTDGGAHWRKLTKGLPTESVGKIEVEVAPSRPDVVYAAILTGQPAGRDKRSVETGGVFRSDDAGETWRRVNEKMTSYFYDHIRVDPRNPDRVWLPVFELWRSDDGGRTFEKHNMRHVHNDLHALWIDPGDPDHMVLGGDGGVNSTFDGGATWMQHVLPIGQFYEVSVDDRRPYRVYGGMQDTGHWMGPSATYDEEGITSRDWWKLRFVGDGMAVQADPRDPDLVYMVQEFGNTSRLDLRDWTRLELQPKGTLRWDWTPAFALSLAEPDTFYLGANVLFKCKVPQGAKRGWVDACRAISPDLTAQQDRKLEGVKDGYHSYGALFAVAQSPADPKVLWAGADDGPIHVSRDDGGHWTRVDNNLKGTPAGAVVSKIEPSRTAAGTAYVALDLHTRDDDRPYLYRTADYGATWTAITGDLPAFGSTFVIREDPRNPRVLYVGTEAGLFVSIDGGGHWVRWKADLPTAPVRALAVQPRERDLVVGTFGRAIWIGDAAPLAQMEAALARPAFLFDVPDAVAYTVRETYGTWIEELNGNMFFRGENPPYGTTVTWWLAENQDGPVTLTVTDTTGKVVRTLEAPATAGLHRVTWDLETDAAKAKKPDEEGDDEPELTRSEAQATRIVPPGTYDITLRWPGEGEAKRQVRVVGETR